MYSVTVVANENAKRQASKVQKQAAVLEAVKYTNYMPLSSLPRTYTDAAGNIKRLSFITNSDSHVASCSMVQNGA